MSGSVRRVYVDLTCYTEGRHPIERECVVGHPTLPDATAISALRRRVLDQRSTKAEPTLWWHRSGNAWAAVTDLHRAGDHDRADVLARFLHWCDRPPHNCVSYWEIINDD